MRIVLDECVNQRLRNHLPGYECQSARYAGLGGLKNGELLAAAEAAGFDVLLTVDRGFQYEQNLIGRKIAVIILSTKSIALKDLVPLVPECVALLLTIKPGEVVKVKGPSQTDVAGADARVSVSASGRKTDVLEVSMTKKHIGVSMNSAWAR